jgi:hypothetical protein
MTCPHDKSARPLRNLSITCRPTVSALMLFVALVDAGCATSSSTSGATTGAAPAGAVTTPPSSADAQGRQRWLDMFARAYFPGRSGQIFVVPRENEVITERDPLYRFMHGSPWRYDTHIPILFYGAPFIRQGQWNDAVAQQDIAPTLARLIGATPAPTFTGRVLSDALAPGSARPRVVTLLVLDAMRADYFDTYADVMPTLTRMRREGAWFSQAHANVLPTVTGVGHATVGTGTDPRIHGITVNTLFNRVTGKSQSAYDALDPRELMALTLGDIWNITTDGKAVIIGQGGAIRATVGLVGRGACLVNGRKVIAASYSTRDAGWETNPTCYTMPEALKAFNGKPVWEAAGGTWMGHNIANPSAFRASSLYQRFESEALIAVMTQAPIGADELTDLVFVNMKGPDYTAHAHGPDSAELKETLAELDRQMAALLKTLDEKAGPQRSVLAITADHGMPGEPASGHRHHPEDIVALIHQKFDPAGKALVTYYSDAANNQLYIDTTRLHSLGFTLKQLAQFLEAQEYFVAAFTEDEVRAGQASLRD